MQVVRGFLLKNIILIAWILHFAKLILKKKNDSKADFEKLSGVGYQAFNLWLGA